VAPANPRSPGLEFLGTFLWMAATGAMFSISLWMLTHDWEHGRARSALIALCALACFALRWPWRPLWIFSPPRSRVGSNIIVGIATILMLGALGEDVHIGLESISHARTTGEIRLDQGQNLFRSAQLLSRGEDPYGRGALIDLEAFNTRLPLRARLGISPRMQPMELRPALARYANNSERSLRGQLLPEPAPGASKEAEREYAMLGHKYGPLPLLVTLPFVHLGPAAIPALQLLVFLCWIAALFWLLRAPALRLAPTAIPVVLALVLLEPHTAHDYLYDSASDAWVLGFCALALGAHLRNRRALTGLAVALALGCKLFPAALFIPLLLARPMRRALLTCAAVLALLYLPFLLWDGRGLWLNLVAWPSLMAPDNTGWLAYFPDAAPAVRASLLQLICALSATDLFGLRWNRTHPYHRFAAVDPARFPAHFALVSACAVLAGSAFHNNYVPWVTTWGFAAIALAFASFPASGSTSAAGPDSPALAPESATAQRAQQVMNIK
jgi:hypothetical protein